jgi:hypothetical protein
MTIKEFLQNKTLTSVEIINNLIINLIYDDTVFGINVDTSNIPSGTLVNRRTDFTLIGDILSVDDISIDITTTNMLTDNDIFNI